MERISQSQLASLIILFQIGSSPLFLLASEAGTDAWLSVFIGMLCGMAVLIAVTLPIYRKTPDKNLAEIFTGTFGKVAGSLFGVTYVVYFGYKAVRNVREFSDLMILYLLPTTPLWFIMFVFLAVAGYAICQGIEVFARIAEILLPIIIIVYIVLFFMIYCTGIFDYQRLLPILDDGLKKVADAAIPELISFPFGEMVLFLMFWKHASPSARTTRTTLFSFLFAGTFITLTNIVIIGSLGTLSGISVVPLMQVVNLVQFANFVERLDPVVALLLFAGVFMKMTAYFFGTTLVFTQVFRMNRRKAVIPVGLLIFMGSLMFRSYMQHIWFGFEKNLKFHFPIFQIGIPVFLLLAVILKSRLQGSKSPPS
ncbi:GerAB/ArcD/ProY family transporter [Cohnella luojiensis]|uniref:Spore gernimation protein n=1 Tax=Cohnella luojiensis TaxID=652876 RepID=A0A4Y8LW41_9BACL|nr:GerAB/ArcD/ProY family transporter [Cohnella luojiensis]TFE25402.1 spore gernimation protein [Cohnella luojiensis]